MSKCHISDDLMDEIMPQKHPMRFVDHLFEYDEKNGRAVADFTVGKNACVGLDDNGNLPVFCLIEVMAQAVAAYKGYVAYINHSNLTVGLLLSVRSLNFNLKGVIPKGTNLISYVEVLFSDEKIEQVKVKTVNDEGDEIANATITVMIPNEEQIEKIFGAND